MSTFVTDLDLMRRASPDGTTDDRLARAYRLAGVGQTQAVDVPSTGAQHQVALEGELLLERAHGAIALGPGLAQPLQAGRHPLAIDDRAPFDGFGVGLLGVLQIVVR